MILRPKATFQTCEMILCRMTVLHSTLFAAFYIIKIVNTSWLPFLMVKHTKLWPCFLFVVCTIDPEIRLLVWHFNSQFICSSIIIHQKVSRQDKTRCSSTQSVPSRSGGVPAVGNTQQLIAAWCVALEKEVKRMFIRTYLKLDEHRKHVPKHSEGKGKVTLG